MDDYSCTDSSLENSTFSDSCLEDSKTILIDLTTSDEKLNDLVGNDDSIVFLKEVKGGIGKVINLELD